MQQVLLEVAHVMATRGTCSRARVGAVFALDGRILATGFNGAPAGLPHCDHNCDCGGDEHSPGYHDDECRSVAPCEAAVHAEANAIAFAAKHGISLNGSTLYTTLSPCLRCAQLLVNAGVRAVCMSTIYRDPSGIRLLNRSGVITHHLAGKFGTAESE
jgi:dCMP deaminase